MRGSNDTSKGHVVHALTSVDAMIRLVESQDVLIDQINLVKSVLSRYERR